MIERRLELATRRGELKARIADQRRSIAAHIAPVRGLMGAADQAARGVEWIKGHPGMVGAGALLFAVLRPRRVWRWARRSLLMWQGWKSLRSRLNGLR